MNLPTRVGIFSAPPRPTRAQMVKYWNRQNWYQVEDDLGGRTIGSDTLFASTPVVVRGRVGSTVISLKNGTAEIIPVHTVTLESITRDEENSAPLLVGSKIFVADNVTPFGKEYADDPVLKPGEEVVLYLRHAEGNLFRGSPVEVYVPTVPFSAKWRIGSDGRYKIPGGSRVAAEVNGLSAIHAYARPRISQSNAVRSRLILSRRGMSASQINALQTDLKFNPLAALKAASKAEVGRTVPSSGENPLL